MEIRVHLVTVEPYFITNVEWRLEKFTSGLEKVIETKKIASNTDQMEEVEMRIDGLYVRECRRIIAKNRQPCPL